MKITIVRDGGKQFETEPAASQPDNHDRPPTPEEIARITRFNTPPEAMNLTPEELERRTKEAFDEIDAILGLPPPDPTRPLPTDEEEGTASS